MIYNYIDHVTHTGHMTSRNLHSTDRIQGFEFSTRFLLIVCMQTLGRIIVRVLALGYLHKIVFFVVKMHMLGTL